jgi:hypothetical protein
MAGGLTNKLGSQGLHDAGRTDPLWSIFQSSPATRPQQFKRSPWKPKWRPKDEAREVKRTKFKFSDKRAALVDLGKHLGMFKGIQEHKHDTTVALVQILQAISPRSKAKTL